MKYSNLLFALIVFIVSCILSNCDSVPEKESSDNTAKKSYVEKQEIKVKVAKVQKTDFAKELVSNGVLTAKEKATVPFTVNEQITKVYVREGQNVKRGKLIAEVENFGLLKKKSDAEGVFEKALIDLEDKLLGYSYALKDTAKVPKGILKMCKIRSGYNTALSALSEVKRNLERTKLIAPISGTIASLKAKANNHSAQYKYCCVVLNNRSMEVEFKVLEGELSMVRLGQAVEVFPFALSGISKYGKIVSVNPMVEKGLVTVRAIVNNSENKFIHGMSVKVLMKNTIPNQVVVPKEAILYRQNRKVVFVYAEGIANWVYVETGQENSTQVCITGKDLSPGDSIIISNNLNLAHETPVVLDQEK